MNSQIKARVHSRSSLNDILSLSQDIDERVVERSGCEQRYESKLITNSHYKELLLLDFSKSTSTIYPY